MRRKFLPLVLTCALLLNSSMAFAADVNETVEGDALTAVSETQEETVVEEETQEEVVTGEAAEASTPVVLEGEGNGEAASVAKNITDEYIALGTNGNPVDGDTVRRANLNENKELDSAVILDVRRADNYANGHLKNAISAPVFDADGPAKTTEDTIAKEFTEKVTTELKSKLEGKEIYIICNSGASGAKAATVLLHEAGYDLSKLHTVTNGAKGLEIRYGMLNTDGNPVTGEEAVKAVSDGSATILDVRLAANYAKGHLKGSISAPVFAANGPAATADVDVAKAFLDQVGNNALGDKDIYVLCNSGASGARAATVLLVQAGYSLNKIHTITGGAKGEAVTAAATYVSASRVIEAINNGEKDVLVLDVRNTGLYAKGHLKGSLSLPLFNEKNELPDDLAKAFTEYVVAHKADFDGKTIYVLCNSGARGAQKAIELLSAAGLKDATLRTIENGAKSELLQANFVTDTKPATTEPAKKPANSKSPKTGDAAPIVPLTVSMFAALCAIVAISKKKIVK